MEPIAIRRSAFPASQILYFDEKAWILLARLPGSNSLVERLRAQAASHLITVPLSSANIIETARTPELAQRARLADLMIPLSRGITIAPHYALVNAELESAIAEQFGREAKSLPTPFGVGAGFAFGDPPLRDIRTRFGDDQVDKLDRFLSTQAGLRALLTGPFDSAFAQLSSEFVDGSRRFAMDAQEARLSLRDISATRHRRYYAGSLSSMIDPEVRAIASRLDIQYDDLTALGPAGLMRLFEQVPSLNVEIELGTQRNLFWNRMIAPNDLADVASLSSGIPYSDIVVTEKFWATLAHRGKLNTRYGTSILADLDALSDALSD